ncbi:MAG: hypothetical protein ACLRQA_00030 [Anaerovoracaceae bacterium]
MVNEEDYVNTDISKRKRRAAAVIAVMMAVSVFALLTDLGKVYAAGETGQVTASLLYVRSEREPAILK